jgi:hypothetical protein
MTDSIRKQARKRSTVTCPQCPEVFKGRSQHKAEAKWRTHWIDIHMVDDPIPEPDGFPFQHIWSD